MSAPRDRALRDPDYPWRRRAPAAEGAPLAARTEAERRRRCCASMLGLVEDLRESGLAGPDGLVYDAQAGFYRFPDARFALSREYADWRGLKEIGVLGGTEG